MGIELPIGDAVLQFTLLLAIVLVLQITLERIRIPAIVGLLVVGVLAGPDGFAVLPREPVVGLLGTIGLLYIMFLAGLEVDLDVVREHKTELGMFGLLAFVLTLLPAVAVGLLLGFDFAGALLLGAALSSHTLLAYPIIERLGIVNRLPVVVTIGGTLVTDTLALVLLVVTIQTATGEGTLGWLGPLVLLAALALLSLRFVPALGRHVLERTDWALTKRVLFLLVTLLVLSSAAELIGTEDILGAFLAGVCLNRLVRGREDVEEHLQFLGRMLFIPFFFIETGMRLEFGVLVGGAGTWLLAGGLLAVILVGKAAAAWITGSRYGFSFAAKSTMTSLALPQAAATLAITVTAGEAGLLDDGVVNAIIVVIFATCLVGPLWTRAAGRRMLDEAKGETAGGGER